MEGRDTLIRKIQDHLDTSGQKYYSGFYVGTTNDPDISFKQHLVKKDRNWWLYVNCDNAATAKDIEKHYLDLGMKGSDRDNDDGSKYIYFYVITSKTKEN